VPQEPLPARSEVFITGEDRKLHIGDAGTVGECVDQKVSAGRVGPPFQVILKQAFLHVEQACAVIQKDRIELGSTKNLSRHLAARSARLKLGRKISSACGIRRAAERFAIQSIHKAVIGGTIGASELARPQKLRRDGCFRHTGLQLIREKGDAARIGGAPQKLAVEFLDQVRNR